MKITEINFMNILTFCLLLLAAPFFSYGQQLPFQNRMLDMEVRVADLLKRLTVEEKVGLMQDVSQPVDRLGIKGYNWWNEALHGVARSGQATVFPQPIGMAASFDSDAIFDVFNAVSDEARAKHHQYAAQGSYARYQGLTMWTPTINIFRDPRWGRGIETYGEDPYLTGVLGLAAVKGLQGVSKNGYDKIHACAKHFAVHSGPEWNRHSFNAANIRPRDLYETYLPAFEKLVKEGNVMEVMCAYNRFEGEPCCGSDQLLMQILREKWGFKGVVVADCGAIADFYKENAHKTHPDAITASAKAVLSGTDLDCGSSYKALIDAVKDGHIQEKDIDVSVSRLLLARFRLGEMDSPNDVPWSKISSDVIASESHDSIALEMARKSMTLLQNNNKILPLKRGGLKVAVMGPNAQDSVMQWGNYNGTPKRTITILAGIQQALGKDDELVYEQGAGLVENIIMESAYSQCFSEEGAGFAAHYWNNKERTGSMVARQLMKTPFALCTSGATVFAPNVELTDFSASYRSTFKPDKTGEVTLQLYVNGVVSLLVDGKEVKTARTGHGARKINHTMKVQKGKQYDIQLDFAHHNGDAQLNFDLGYREVIDIQRSLARVADVDVVVFVGGISPSLEGEEMGVDFPGFKRGDRIDIELPTVQREFLTALSKAGKKVVFVNCSGSPIGLAPETERCEAILQAWYPGQAGGRAVADVLFGAYNPSGRLPVTFYRDTTQLPDFENYDMTGRTYRYLKEKPLFPFGHGLSYSRFDYGTPMVDRETFVVGDSVCLTVPIANSSTIDGDEIVQVYIKRVDDQDEGPIKSLRAVQRVHIPAGEKHEAKIWLSSKQFEFWNESNQRVDVFSGKFRVFVGGSSTAEDLRELTLQIL